MDSERSNFHPCDLVFQPVATRIHCLMDLSTILTQRSQGDNFTLTDWSLTPLSKPKKKEPYKGIKPKTGPLKITPPKDADFIIEGGRKRPRKPVVSKGEPGADPLRKGQVCPISTCGQRFSRSSRVLDHMRSTHATEGRASIRCPGSNCGLVYDAIAAFRSHQKSTGHKGHSLLFDSKPVEKVVRDIIVEQCGEVFRYRCPFCQKLLKTRYRCSFHMEQCKDRDSKQFQCLEQDCGKTFACKESLNRHMRTCAQTGKKPQKNQSTEETNSEKTSEAGKNGLKSRVAELVDLIEES